MEITKSLDSKIMVKAPYNILYDLQTTHEGSITAKVKNEFSLPEEHGPISASEAGRHLAILGSIALSHKSEESNYYLAKEAEIKRQSTSVGQSEVFYAQSTVISQNKRTGEVAGRILDKNHHEIYSIVVKYQIINTTLFAKLFRGFHNQEPIYNTTSPYQSRKELSEITITEDEITANYGTVLANECEGHFKDYPALPVAIICNSFTSLGLKLFLNTNAHKFTKAMATHALIKADRLVFSGEQLSFKGIIKHESQDNNTMTVYFEGLVNHKKVAEATFTILGV